jgi:hypothetical protein
MGKKNRRDRKSSSKSLEDDFLTWLDENIPQFSYGSNDSTGSILTRLIRLLDEGFGEKRLFTLVRLAAQKSVCDRHIMQVVQNFVVEGRVELAKPWICVFQILLHLQLTKHRVSLRALAIYITCHMQEFECKIFAEEDCKLQGAFYFTESNLCMRAWTAINESCFELNGFQTNRHDFRLDQQRIKVNVVCCYLGIRNEYSVCVNPTITFGTFLMMLLGKIDSHIQKKFIHKRKGHKGTFLTTNHRHMTLSKLGLARNDTIQIEEISDCAIARISVESRGIDSKATLKSFLNWAKRQIDPFIDSVRNNNGCITTRGVLDFWEESCRVYSFGLYLSKLTQPRLSTAMRGYLLRIILIYFNTGSVSSTRAWFCTSMLMIVFQSLSDEIGHTKFTNYVLRNGKLFDPDHVSDVVFVAYLEQITLSRVSMSKYLLSQLATPVDYSLETQHITITAAVKRGNGIGLKETFSINPTIKCSTVIMILRSKWGITQPGWTMLVESNKTLVESDETLTENGIKDNDQIVLIALDVETQKDSSDVDKSEPNCNMCEIVPKPTIRKRKKPRRSQTFYLNDDTDKVEHSKKLTLVFDEAFGLFQERRQKLNSLVLDKCPAKQKAGSSKVKPTNEETMNHNCDKDVGGKAGKTVFPVIIGLEEYLYKSSKRHNHSAPIQRIDLHGRDREEALRKLNDSLPNWMNAAMKTDHPFSIRVDIISGGGNQIIADTVEHWIRQNRNVANRF